MRIDFTLNNIISEMTAKIVVEALEAGVGDDIREDLRKNELIKPNSTPFRIWDYINRNIHNFAVSKGLLADLTKRGPWSMSILFDPEKKTVITLMRENRFDQLRKQKPGRRSKHYLDAFAECLNNDLTSPYKQQSLLPTTQRNTADDASEIVEKMLSSFENVGPIEHHVLVLFSSRKFQLTGVRAVTIDADLDIVEEVNLLDLITASESIVQDTVQKEDGAFNNPTRGLKLTAKAASRQTRMSKLRDQNKEKQSE